MNNQTYYCKMTKTKHKLKDGTKLVFVQVGEPEVSFLTEEHYRIIVDSCPFFRRLGGSEYVERTYTHVGYLPFKITSKKPDRKVKVVREFDFNI